SSASTYRWRNVENPSYRDDDFDRDLYQCTRLATLHPEWRSQRDMFPVPLTPEEGIAESCLHYRGWRKERSTGGSSARPIPGARRPPLPTTGSTGSRPSLTP